MEVRKIETLYDSSIQKCILFIDFDKKIDVSTINNSTIMLNGGDSFFEQSDDGSIKIEKNSIKIAMEGVVFNKVYPLRICGVKSIFGEELGNPISTNVCFRTSVESIPNIIHPIDMSVSNTVLTNIMFSDDCIDKNIEVYIDDNTSFKSPVILDLKEIKQANVLFDFTKEDTFFIKSRYYALNDDKEYGDFSDTISFKIQTENNSCFQEIDESVTNDEVKIISSYFDEKKCAIVIEFSEDIKNIESIMIKASPISSPKRRKIVDGECHVIDDTVIVNISDESNFGERTFDINIHLVTMKDVSKNIRFSVYDIFAYCTVDEVMSLIPSQFLNKITEKDILYLISENTSLIDFIYTQSDMRIPDDEVYILLNRYVKYKSAITIILKQSLGSEKIEGTVADVTFSRSAQQSKAIDSSIKFFEDEIDTVEQVISGKKSYGIVAPRSTILFKNTLPVKRFRRRW